MELNELLIETKDRDASDLHITVGVPPVLRINGKLQKMNLPVLDANDVHEIVSRLLSEEQENMYQKLHELDFSHELKNVARFRINVFQHRRGEAIAFRLIPEKIKTVEQLGLPEEIISFTNKSKGFVLVTGPTGSGKSTTLAALIDIINKERYEHIITIEDPIEFVHEH
ncbi:MAG: Flp pilus assembly complex ATPase component TadA, partial [Candidatus Atribacteria bacterium]|nr:Flp pilus assembly complex ATPase component TadA [Candidatus Atribacteria bacterium]